MKGFWIFVIITFVVIFLFDNPTEEDQREEELIECPACSSHNTDGNTCMDCGEEF